MLRYAFFFLLAFASCFAQDGKLRILAIGAHPDDCDIKFGGTAAKFAKAGHAVKFLSVTNGDAGHHEMGGGILAQRRYKETQESARRLGISEYEVLDTPDGLLEPTLPVRKEIIRAIREWEADVVIGPRPNDYHPDHRYTGVLMQDAAYMVVVPNLVPNTKALRKNPVFIYYQDGFQKPAPFEPDIAVAIDDILQTKLNGLDAHVSQFYEWLPWVEHKLDQVPSDPAARKKWLEEEWTSGVSPAVREALEKRYGSKGSQIKHAEAFEVCEYGRQPSWDELNRIFPK
jgi:LmbE family N-acetylglucosaminyl deacetylase